MKIRWVTVKVFRVGRLYGRTDTHKEASSRFSQTALRRRLVKVDNRCTRTKVQNTAKPNMKPTNSGNPSCSTQTMEEARSFETSITKPICQNTLYHFTDESN